MTFIYYITPVKENFLNTKTDEDDKIIGEHWDYLVKSYNEGKVRFAGRTNGAEFGICIFEAEDVYDAEQFTLNDPAVAKNVFKALYYPFSIALEFK